MAVWVACLCGIVVEYLFWLRMKKLLVGKVRISGRLSSGERQALRSLLLQALKKNLDSFLFEREKKLDSCFRRKPEPRELVREAIILMTWPIHIFDFTRISFFWAHVRKASGPC